MLSHFLTPVAPSTAKPGPLIWRKLSPSPFSSTVWACSRGVNESPEEKQVESPEEKQVRRRGVLVGLAGAAVAMSGGVWEARGAARRPPPPPPQEKTDPNVSGLAAKVLASKKRKEALKESIAKLREKGKPIKEPSE